MMENWNIQKLSSVLKIQNGYAFDSKLFTAVGGMQLIRIRDLKNGIKTEINYSGAFDQKYLVSSGEFLIGMDGEFGCFEWKGINSLLNQRVCKLSQFSDNINPRFLFYGINKYLKEIEEVTAFTTVKHISSKQIENIEIPIPSLSEQNYIVELIDKSFSAIDRAKANLEKNLQNAKDLFQSELNSILTDTRWEVRELGSVCKKVEYGSSAKSVAEGSLPVLRMGNIRNGRFNWDNLVFSNNEKDNEQYLLRYNDVLFNRTNSPELVGKTAIYKGERPAIFAGYLIRIHRDENLLDANYLNYYLNSDVALGYGKTVVISSVNQANINGSKLKTYPIPLPTLVEQQIIVERLDRLNDQIEGLAKIYTQKLQNLEELKKSILQKAFTGQLTQKEIPA